MPRWWVECQLYVVFRCYIHIWLEFEVAMYTRAAASDYDDWESVYGNPGWGSKHLIPLLRKVPLVFIHLHKVLTTWLIIQAETFQFGVPGVHSTHGTSGPIKISIAEDEFNVGSQFLAVAAEYDKERAFTEDTNDFFTCNAYGVSKRCVLIFPFWF